MEYRLSQNIDLGITFDCGQCFRFQTDEKGVTVGVAGDKLFKGYVKDGVLYTDTDPSHDGFFINYLDLKADYHAFNREITKSGDKIIEKAALLSSGLHILNQDPFETLISFIISQNNNIPRIRGIIERFCELYGEKKCFNGTEYRAFPTPKQLYGVTADDLAPIRAGFRAKYIADAVEKWNKNEIPIDFLYKGSYNECNEILKSVKGVGDKVSACVLLFAFHRLDAFPVDVWIRRTMESLYGDLDYKRFGAYPGLAQQYLFYYSRYLSGGIK
ncbi:MAG: DNA-3-methyladenine glycosylase 2 [Clostridia bacterium]|nr:DNA-3-methyladenine glycosylase 2 [Clostridia bacterium]MBR2327328.1 DNA-3-methyladenine glycosylase 2 [Clostridia bacterium]